MHETSTPTPSSAPTTPLERLGHFLRRAFLIEGSPYPLGIYRILLGLTVMYEAWHNFRRIPYYTPETFHFPYVDFIQPLPIGALPRQLPSNEVLWAALGQLTWPNTIEMLFAWEFLFAILLAVGLLTRASALGILLTQGYALFICQLNFRNHIYLMLLCVLIVLFSPAGRALSVDSLLRYLYGVLFPSDKSPQPKDTLVWVPLTAQRLIGIQIAVMYFWATTHKLQPGFLTGYPIGLAVSRAVRKATFANLVFTPEQIQQLSDLFANPTWQPLFAYMTVFAEGFLAVGLFFPATRLAAICIGIGLHFGIYALMDIHTFGLLGVSAYVCFWIPRWRYIPIEGLPLPSEPDGAGPDVSDDEERPTEVDTADSS